MKKLFFSVGIVCIAGLPVAGQLQISKKAIKPSLYKRIQDGVNGARFETPNGSVSIKFALNQPAKNDIIAKSTPLNTAMCLTREEVKGQKIESELVIADASKALQILPGAVIDGSKLLQSGEFIYVKMDKRKPLTLSTTSNLAKVTSATVTPAANENIEAKIRSKTQSLTRPSNLNGMPNIKSDGKVTTSTSQENTGIEVGASFFYMGISAEDNFSFSSEKYRYMYLFEFEQECLPVLANSITSPADVFADNGPAQENWYYIREVKYGRRLYVLIESQSDLEKYSNEFSAGLNWGVVSAAYSQKNTGQSFFSTTNIRIITQGGQPVTLTDVGKLQATLDKYFNAPFKDIDIVPLSYKLTSLNGTPVSMISKAFLDGNNCLDKSKVRIRIKSIQCMVADDGGMDEQVYGAVTVLLYNTDQKVVAPDGKTVVPNAGVQIPTGFIRYAKEEAPLVISPGKPKEFAFNQQDKYLDVSISNLDMTIELKPAMKEKDNISDDIFITDNKFKKTIRKMLMEGTTINTFEFRHDKSVVNLTMEVAPLY